MKVSNLLDVIKFKFKFSGFYENYESDNLKNLNFNAKLNSEYNSFIKNNFNRFTKNLILLIL